jgi:anti-sigma factor RsiW
MTDLPTALKLQAHLDGELAPGEAREMVSLLQRDAEARGLFDELQSTRRLLAANEPEIKMPESREFYWSKIRRELERLDREPEARPRRVWGLPQWLRLALPAGAVLGAVLVFAAVMLHRSAFAPGPGSPLFAVGDEIETPLEEMNSFTFRSESARMTVVWVSDTFVN